MALDDILGNLSVEEEGKRVVNPNYDAGQFIGAVDGLAKLKDVDVSSVEGLKAYAALTGDDPSRYSANEAEQRKGQRYNGGQGDLSAYVEKHVSKLLKEVGDEARVGLAFKYCPEGESVSGDDAYVETQGRIARAKVTMDAIKNNPKKYLTEELEGETPLMISYIMRDVDAFLDLRMREAQRSGVLSIGKYGAEKFLESTRRYLAGQRDTLQEEVSGIEKNVAAKIDAAEKGKGNILTSEEMAMVISDDRKAMEEAHKKYSDAQAYSGFVQEVSGNAIAEIKRKSEE
jgi:hypothetical protein